MACRPCAPFVPDGGATLPGVGGAAYPGRMDPLAALGLPSPALNATGTSTRAGAARLSPEVRAAMDAAAGLSFDMAALHGAAGRRAADLLKVPAAFVTTGAAAALAMGAAAAIARDSIARMNRLPETEGMRHEFLVARSHRSAYDRALLLAGARLVEVGIPDRQSSAGVRDAEAGDFADAITPRTAGILYLAQPEQEPALPELAALARQHDLILIVDAAGQLPPASLPDALIAQGADLVAVSGGKAIGGPAGTGLLLGRPDLIASALLQSLDLDFLEGSFVPDPALAPALRDPRRLPTHGIGRAMKVGKEEIVGLLAALTAFTAADPAMETARRRALVGTMAEELGRANGLVPHVVEGPAPRLEVAVDAAALGFDARALALALARRDPPVLVGHRGLRTGRLVLDPANLRGEEESRALGRALREAARRPTESGADGT
ncbi:aminotransferase class V-fold PLP-dependent enzyme [Muricoccus radiodurans]|uniref:aminotransferase class V-fold PLP-dependent enzyme n=1 Tax=Muricoccus radiodurans TaxID=2231721 RepID=UPI003CF876FF